MNTRAVEVSDRGPLASPVNENSPALAALKSADLVVRAVINQLETIVNKPTRDWDVAERKYAMEVLATTSATVIAHFEECREKEILIRNAGRLVGCLDSIRTMARLASFGYGNRNWGRGHLKTDLQRLKIVFEDGCALDAETVIPKAQELPNK